jgi:hypothetical protein
MSETERAAQHAMAIEVVVFLRTYERHILQLVATWFDMPLYQAVSSEIDEIRACCASLPETSVAWVGVLISHADLVHCLWRSSQAHGKPAADEIQSRLSEHLACIATLAHDCERLAATPQAEPHTEPQRAWT